MILVETHKALHNAVQAFRDEPLLAIDAEGVPATIALLQVATPTHVYLLDGVKLGAGPRREVENVHRNVKFGCKLLLLACLV